MFFRHRSHTNAMLSECKARVDIPKPEELFAHLVVLLHDPLAREQLATHILAVLNYLAPLFPKNISLFWQEEFLAESLDVIQDNDRVGTLHYRPPEILLGSNHYSTAVDVWSIGCILAEMVNQETLFPGETENDQLLKIFSVRGTPNAENWPGVTSLVGFQLEFPNQDPSDLKTVVPNLEPAGVDLLSEMLCLDPSKRITAENALQHGYFKMDGFVL